MGPEHIADFVRQLALWALPLLAAVIFHEVAHGVVALRLGDDTAFRMGRLTLNPLPHIDPIGTVLLPAMLLFSGMPVFGYAKPVPVDYSRLRNPKRDMVLVAVAGPLTNIVLATACAIFLRQIAHYVGGLTDADELAVRFTEIVLIPLAAMAKYAVVINVVLAVFNLLPIPPLDGGRVLTGILPYAQARLVARLEPFGFLIVMALLMTRTLGVILDAPVRLLLHVLL